MGIFGGRKPAGSEPEASADPRRCGHPNREDMRTFGAGGLDPNKWRCKDCGYEPGERS